MHAELLGHNMRVHNEGSNLISKFKNWAFDKNDSNRIEDVYQLESRWRKFDGKGRKHPKNSAQE